MLVKLFTPGNLYEIYKDKIFEDASKTTKSTKILVPKVLGYTVCACAKYIYVANYLRLKEFFMKYNTKVLQ